MTDRLARASRAVLVATATAVAIAAIAVAPFLSPAWIGPGQERAGASAATGYSAAQLDLATGAILSDLVFGPPDFDVEVAGQPVLNERERSHMSDVRGVFVAFAAVAALAVLTLVVAAVLARGSRELWRPVRAGAIVLAATVSLLALVALIAFETGFELFHRLFFAGGTYTFDPATDRLVQLFPMGFWLETTLALGALIVFLSVLVAFAASRLARQPSRDDRHLAGARLEHVR